MKYKIRQTLWFAAAIWGILWLTGCTHIFTDKKPAKSANTQTASAASSISAPADSQQTRAVYYDFEDVLIPLELSVLQDKSMIVSTPGFTSGILMLKGRVDRRSLINFFNNNMRKDNWSMVSQIASPNMAILVFEKPMKSGVISIKSEHIYTYVEIGVAARINQGSLPEKMGDMFESDLTQ
jgi:hypothetical protein